MRSWFPILNSDLKRSRVQSAVGRKRNKLAVDAKRPVVSIIAKVKVMTMMLGMGWYQGSRICLQVFNGVVKVPGVGEGSTIVLEFFRCHCAVLGA
jgi:P2-related tail formation protein